MFAGFIETKDIFSTYDLDTCTAGLADLNNAFAGVVLAAEFAASAIKRLSINCDIAVCGNRKAAYLAHCHKKARVRKKNQHRIDKELRRKLVKK